MNKITTFIKRIPKKASLLVLILAAAIIIPANLFAWGPDRPTYTIEHPADHVTFDSITNNPDYGDERNFVTIKDALVIAGRHGGNNGFAIGKDEEAHLTAG